MERTPAPAVVVPGSGAGSSLACVRSLGRRGLRPVVAGADSAAASSTFCDRAVDVPDPDADLAGYADALLDLAERQPVETVLPVGDAAARVLTRNRDLFAERTATPWACRTQTAVLRDRDRLFAVAREAGVPVPTTTGPSTGPPSDGPDATADGPTGAATTSDGGRVMDAAGRTPGPGPTPARPDPGRTAPDAGADLGLFALFDEGEPLAWLGFRRRRTGTGLPGGAYRETVRDPALREHGLTLLSELEWHGQATLSFGRDREGDTLRLRDATPRFDGALPLALAAGVDLPWLHYRLATGDPPDEPPGYEAGVGCHDLCAELAAGDVARTAATLVAQPNFDYLRGTDPRPFLDRALDALVGGHRATDAADRR